MFLYDFVCFCFAAKLRMSAAAQQSSLQLFFRQRSKNDIDNTITMKLTMESLVSFLV